MPKFALHHLAVNVADLDRALAFYRDILGLKPLPRPDFPVKGAWLDAGGGRQVHVTEHPGETIRRSATVDNNDGHFALTTDDFDGAVALLEAHGYAESAPDGDPRRMLVKRTGPAGFAQLYVLDPDLNIIEINTAS